MDQLLLFLKKTELTMEIKCMYVGVREQFVDSLTGTCNFRGLVKRLKNILFQKISK